jgi:hypothetical protein
MKYILTIFAVLACGIAYAQAPSSNYNEQGGLNTVIGGTLTITGAVVEAYEDLTAASTLDSTDCGSTKFLNAATEFATTLPSPSAGCSITFFVKAAPASASYTVVTASSANILIGGINELEVDTGDDGPYDADGDTITFVDGVSVVGDYVTLFSDGTSWYLHGQANADGGVTVTKAS